MAFNMIRDSDKINLHNHTTYSDGKFTPEDIVEAAVDFGLSHVAITDHYRTAKVKSIDAEELRYYTAHIRDLGKKYEGKIRVLVGVEIDSCPERTNLYALPYALLNDLDFVLFEYVQDDDNGGMPLWQLLKFIKRIRVPVGLAHNDIAKNFANVRADVFVRLLSVHGIFIELCSSLRNSKFGRQYYHYAERFFDFARGKVLLSIGSDTHNRLSDVGNIEDAVRFVRKLGLVHDLITYHYWSDCLNREGGCTRGQTRGVES
ncbi:MAG: histidinol-phosphatase [Thermoplasmata archaeon]|nr:MAG: histidinol-phosphatase [Thermoplasmata archaeon]